MPYTVDDRIKQHRAFWRGEGPSLIFVPTGGEGYPLDDYTARYHDPELMWNSEIDRARHVVDWPTDGIPAVRPNLGVTFAPTVAGQECLVRDGMMPWPGPALGRDSIRRVSEIDVERAESVRLAREFYDIHRERGDEGIYPYHADTQGVFDIAHLLYQDEVFYDLADPDESAWIDDLMAAAGDLYVNVSQTLKRYVGEAPGEMIHGHGTTQGLLFPSAGVRMAEDTPTLLSPEMIERVVRPAIERAAEPFDGAFTHFCGYHEGLLDMLCEMPCVRAVDLGNPEMYDTTRVMARCAESGTVLHSRVAALDDEPWESYTRRVAGLARSTGARVILRPESAPTTRDDAARMLDTWNELTA